MFCEFIKGKGWKKKLKIREEENTSCDGVFNECSDENIRIENQPYAFEALA
jgi:hypothetical protein